jgi:hypothetical protein
VGAITTRERGRTGCPRMSAFPDPGTASPKADDGRVDKVRALK